MLLLMYIVAFLEKPVVPIEILSFAQEEHNANSLVD